MKLEIITPFGQMLKTTCDEVVSPGVQGEFGVLQDHIPLLTTVPSGLLWYRQNNDVKYIAVSNGYAEVASDRILLLVETAEAAEKIDLERATANMERFQKMLDAFDGPIDSHERVALHTRFLREQARIEAVTRLKH